MKLTKLAQAAEYIELTSEAEITGIEFDSRRVQHGDMFCCIVGTFQDGHKYAADAVEKGASALLVQTKLELDIPQIVVKDSRKAMALMAAYFYGNPAKKMRFAGVTGTNGKTSTTFMLKAIAEKAGLKVGLIGTIMNMIGDKRIRADRTTPESVDLHKTLAMMVDEGIELVVMEVSSHSLDQMRVYGIEFEAGAFTNLTQDHMDYHKSFENYLAAKKKLFNSTKAAVINIDDGYANEITAGTDCSVTTFGISSEADIYATDIEITTSGVEFMLNTKLGSTMLDVHTPGLFSVYNAMCAAGLAMKLGFDLDTIKDGIGDMGSVAGRLEPLPTGGRNFNIFLDFAHTPDALENVLKAVRSFSKGRIVTVFGCGGDRDRAKRPIMGEAAGRFSDYLVVSSDNPRTEDPMAIIEMVVEGVEKSGCPYTVIENRREAIRFAIENARKNDCIVLAGKGHENYQEINGVKHHFDEKEVVAEIIAELDGRA